MYDYTDEIGSPGMGISPIKLSRDPLATEAEATRGPDDAVDWDEIESADMGVADVPGFEPRDFSEEDVSFGPTTLDVPPLANDWPRF